MQWFHKSIEYVKGVGPAKAEILQKEVNVFTWKDLIEYYPFRYVDKSQFHTIDAITDNTQYIQIKGVLTGFQLVGPPRRKRLVGKFVDETGSIDLVWFRSADWIMKNLTPGAEYIVYGKPNKYGKSYNIAHPEIKSAALSETEGNRLDPVYNTTEKLKKKGLDTKGVAKLVRHVFSALPPNAFPEIFPDNIVSGLRLLSREEAYHAIHFPNDEDQLQKAKFRIIFEELFFIQIRLLRLNLGRKQTIEGFVFEQISDRFHRFFNEKLPFELTQAQKRVIKEIRKDTLSGNQMNRLLQGDVGSGKTIVCLMTILMAIDNGYQGCLMAPTEILAQQHYQGIVELLDGLSIRVALLTGSVKGKERKQLLVALKEGLLDILIGTHALIEDPVVFKNLGVAIIDEQHRFGVAQRAKLSKKNTFPPHVLVMTATPIPRTLALTLYGDLDVSVIDELPPGRKPIKTIHRRDDARLAIFGFLKREIEKRRQVYIVYPLIEESEKLDYKHLMDGYESIQRAFPTMPVSILHGRMKSEDKDYEMDRFVRGETKIMVATTVIEVGVNVPNASVMVIESAERFGLSQLHQLRGRVGRGADQSYCILVTGMKLSSEARNRMRIMCETNDGFKIAEADLKMRGPGDLEGTQQSGITDLKLANLSKDQQVLGLARTAAQEVLTKDPNLENSEHRALKNHITQQTQEKEWSRVL